MRNSRTLLFIAGTVYLLWWFAVEWLLPNSFNPFGSRLATVAVIFALFLFTLINQWAARHSEWFFVGSVWLITAHFFYLFVGNQGEMNWIIGSFITVSAISITFISQMQLLAYSIFVMGILTVIHALLGQEHSALFFPGMLTILLQANISWGIRFRVLENLTRSKDRFAFLFNSAFEGMMVHDGERIMVVNDAMAKMFEYRPEEMIGMKTLDLVIPREQPLLSQNMGLTDTGIQPYTGVTKYGHYLEIETRGKEFFENGKRLRQVAFLNVGDRKKAESERVRAATMAENVRLRDEFISIASHELRTPLSSLKLQSDLLKREFNRDVTGYSSEKFGSGIGTFNRQVNRLVELVESMLDTSRGSIGDIPISRVRMDLSARVRDVVGTFTESVQVVANESILVHADPSRIGQVIENLLTNAIKYGDGQPVEVSVSQEDARAVLRVRDHGVGIAAENLNRIFDRFERAVTNQSISGLGLGLYITKKIVEAHGGTIEVESELGKGSIFTVRLSSDSCPK